MADWNTFIGRYPEFAGGDANVGAKVIADATAQINVLLWGTLSDQGIYLLTAQILAKSPFGNAAKLMNKDGETVYDEQLDRLRLSVTAGNRST